MANRDRVLEWDEANLPRESEQAKPQDTDQEKQWRLHREAYEAEDVAKAKKPQDDLHQKFYALLCEVDQRSPTDDGRIRHHKWAKRLVAIVLAAGYHRCTGEWPVLTQEEIEIIIESHRLVDYPTDIPTHIAKAQRDADRKRCPAQEEK